MDAIECIKTRMSIRGFKPDPVPKELLLQVIETATRSPSYRNSQPWEVAIVSGQKKEALSKLLLDRIEQGIPIKPDLAEPTSWPDAIDARIKAHNKKRSETLGITVDAGYLKKSKIANSTFYGAPHGIFLFQDSSLSLWSILDMGMFAQSLMLAAHAHGLGTVPQAFLTDYSAEIKNFLGIPQDKRLMLGLSIGYPDPSAKANSYRSDRREVEEVVRWVE